jgi:hypothetical protein
VLAYIESTPFNLRSKVLNDFLLQQGTRIGVPIVLSVLSVLYLNRTMQFFEKLQNKVKQYQAHRANILQLGENASTPTLSISVSRDEPSFALYAAATIPNLVEAILSKEFVLFTAAIVLPWILMFSGIFPEGTIFNANNSPTFYALSSTDYWLGWMFLLVCELFLAPLLVMMALGFSLLAHRLFHASSYGEEGWFDNWLLKISHTNRPFGWELVSQETFLVKPAWWRIWSPLAHSLVYDNSIILDKIADWISSLPLDPARGAYSSPISPSRVSLPRKGVGMSAPAPVLLKAKPCFPLGLTQEIGIRNMSAEELRRFIRLLAAELETTGATVTEIEGCKIEFLGPPRTSGSGPLVTVSRGVIEIQQAVSGAYLRYSLLFYKLPFGVGGVFLAMSSPWWLQEESIGLLYFLVGLVFILVSVAYCFYVMIKLPRWLRTIVRLVE